MLSLLLITSLVLKYLQFNWNSYDETNSSFWLCMSKQYYHASQIGMYSNDKQELGLCLVLQHIFIMTDKVYAFVWQNHCKDCDVRHYSFILSLSTLNVSGSMIVLWFMCMCTKNETKYKHDNSQSLLKDFLTTHKTKKHLSMDCISDIMDMVMLLFVRKNFSLIITVSSSPTAWSN